METSEDEDVFVDAAETLSDRLGDVTESESSPEGGLDERFGASLENLGLEDIELELPPISEAEALLDGDIEELKIVVQKFLNSQFPEAEKMLKQKFQRSLYFTHGYAVLMTIKSLMTFEPLDIGNALALLKVAVEVAHVYRKRDHSIITNLQGFVKGYSLENMTRLQRHAELIYAEAYLLKALITILNDESLVSIVREAVNIRFSYMTYKQCHKWLEKTVKMKSNSDKKVKRIQKWIKRKRSKSDSDSPISDSGEIDVDFVSGVRFGIGIFNLIFSLLPARTLKIFEAMGFGGSRELALDQLGDPMIEDGLRRFMCDFALLVYHVVISTFITTIKPDLELVDAIIEKGLIDTPNSAFVFYFAARTMIAKKKLAEAIPFYQKSIQSQDEWIQLHHICYWDMALCWTAQLNFSEAAKCMEHLDTGSRWSKAVYKYLLASHLLMAIELNQITSGQEAVRNRIDQLFSNVPNVMQKIAGKRIPIEKFVSRKSRKYFMQEKRLLLPIFEMMIMWNTFEMMTNAHLQMVHDILLKTLTKLTENYSDFNNMPPYETFFDDYCLTHLLLSITVREMGKLKDSEDFLKRLFDLENRIKLDHYISPFARFEYGRLLMKHQPPNLSEARDKFESARKDYRKFSMENNLHFRVHNSIAQIDMMEKAPEIAETIAEDE